MVEEHKFSDSSSGQEDADPPSESGASDMSSEPELELDSALKAGSASDEEDSEAELEHGDAGIKLMGRTSSSYKALLFQLPIRSAKGPKPG